MIWVYGFLVAEAVMSVVAFGAYGLDKRKARRGEWRIRERTLLMLAVCLGAPGAFAAMKRFRHKTQHRSFRLLVPLCLMVQGAALAWLVCGAI